MKRIPVSVSTYRMRKTEHQKLLRQKKLETISKEILEIGNNSKKLYERIRELTGSFKMNPLPTGDSQELADDFSDF